MPRLTDSELMDELQAETYAKKRLVPPSQYLTIRNAGNGVAGEVFFCIPTSAARSFKEKTVAMDKDAALCLIRRKLVAVKVVNPDRYINGDDEVKAMQQILGQARGSDAPHHCAQMLKHGHAFQSGKGFVWLALKPYPASITLFSLLLRYPTMPEELIFHLFIQLTEALHFLRNVCKPPIAHKDIWLGNLMLDTISEPGFPGFPNVVLIDFGNAVSPASMFDLGADLGRVYAVLFEMCMMRPKCKQDASTNGHSDCGHPEGWVEFQDFLGRRNGMGSWCDKVPLGSTLRFGEMAKNARAKTSVERLWEIKEVVDTAVSESESLLAEDLTRALKLGSDT